MAHVPSNSNITPSISSGFPDEMLVPSAFLMDGERHSENEVFCQRTQGPREIWDLESDCKATASPQNCINPFSLRVTSI